MYLYQIENLTYYYPESARPALEKINLAIREGEFLLLVGGSGSGKSSLARVLAGLIPDFYGGYFGGKIYFRGRDMAEIDRRHLAREVGMAFQDPEKQLVMTNVEAEIAFGPENLGLPREEMARRVAEVMAFLDLTTLRRKSTAHLSGGEKQKLALAAVLAGQPQVLILDEPTSQLDPAAAEDFLNLIKRLNEDMGLTIVLIEQRLERCFHLADRVVFMKEGKIHYEGPPRKLARWAAPQGIPFVPPVTRFFAEIGCLPIPVTVKEGRRLLRTHFQYSPPPPGPSNRPVPGPPLVAVEKVWFTYPNGSEALQGVSLQIAGGELVAILGANGAGKSTLLKVMAGLLSPGRGRVWFMGRKASKGDRRFRGGSVAYLSQNPNDYLFQDTVEEELLFTLRNFGLPDEGVVSELLHKLRLAPYRQVNPRDLSSGERQRVALAAVLVTRPRLLLLDEPTRGLDGQLKQELGEMLQEFAVQGAAVVVVTHDVEFAAAYASRVAMMWAGRLITDGPKHRVLGESIFYSTQIGRMCRGHADGVLTLSEARQCLRPVRVARPAGQVKAFSQSSGTKNGNGG